MKITLYGFGVKPNDPSRVARVRWLLKELELPYDEVNVIETKLYGTEELKAISLLGALPAIVIDGKTLMESAAICTYLADQFPEKGLISPSGTWERAEHDQWTSYALTEMEAWLWSSAKHTIRYPEERRVPAILPSNTQEFKESAAVLEKYMQGRDYLVAGKFSVTDIIVSYALNWGRLRNLISEFPNLTRYVARMLERPACVLARELPR